MSAGGNGEGMVGGGEGAWEVPVRNSTGNRLYSRPLSADGFTISTSTQWALNHLPDGKQVFICSGVRQIIQDGDTTQDGGRSRISADSGRTRTDTGTPTLLARHCGSR